MTRTIYTFTKVKNKVQASYKLITKVVSFLGLINILIPGTYRC
jgi:hypothetical protein